MRKSLFRAFPVPVELVFRVRQRRVRAAQRRIELDRAERSLALLREDLAGRLHAVEREEVVHVGEPRPRKGFVRVALEDLLEQGEALLVRLLGPLVPLVAGAQVEVPGLGVVGRAAGEAFLVGTAQRDVQRSRDLLRDLGRQRGRAGAPAREPIPPDLRAALHVEELGLHRDGVRTPLHAAGEDGLDPELPAGLARDPSRRG